MNSEFGSLTKTDLSNAFAKMIYGVQAYFLILNREAEQQSSYAYTTPLSFLFRGANGLISVQLFNVANSCCLNDYQGIRAPSLGN